MNVIRGFLKGHFMSENILDNNIKLTISPFATLDDDKVSFDGRINANRQEIFLKIKRGLLKVIDHEILFAISNLRFCTSRQITQYLNYIRDIDIKQSVIQQRLNVLNKNSIISRYKFSNENPSLALKVYCLEQIGKDLLRSKNYICHWQPTDTIYPEQSKKFLARNQFLLNCSKHLSNIKSYKISEKLGTLQTDLILELDNNSNYVVEVFRKNQTQEEINKILIEYNTYLTSSENLKKYSFIAICEEDPHAFQIYKSIYMNKLSMQHFFTTDLRLIEEDISKIFIKFIIEDNKVLLNQIEVSNFRSKVNNAETRICLD